MGDSRLLFVYCFCSLPLTRGEEEKKKKKKKLHHHQCLGEMNKDIKEHTQGSGGGRQHPRKGFKKKGGGVFFKLPIKKGGAPRHKRLLSLHPMSRSEWISSLYFITRL